jgi:hypothetical protein
MHHWRNAMTYQKLTWRFHKPVCVVYGTLDESKSGTIGTYAGKTKTNVFAMPNLRKGEKNDDTYVLQKKATAIATTGRNNNNRVVHIMMLGMAVIVRLKLLSAISY